MEYFLTTYNKDYKWPVTFSTSKNEKHQKRLEEMLQAQTGGAGDADPCQVGLTPPITAPEIAPAQCGAPPVGPESMYGQPNTYLRKLYMKYPYLYNILSITPPQELAKIAYADKFQSTYRSDYKMEGFTPLRSWLVHEMPEEMDDDVIKAAQIDDSHINRTTIEQGYGDSIKPVSATTVSQMDSKKPGCQCPAAQAVCTCDVARKADSRAMGLATTVSTPVTPKPISITKIPRAPLYKKREEEKKPPEYTGSKKPPKPGKMKSEYKDTISRMGSIIIEKKLLNRIPKEDHRK